jgi:hypothetical protein
LHTNIDGWLKAAVFWPKLGNTFGAMVLISKESLYLYSKDILGQFDFGKAFATRDIEKRFNFHNISKPQCCSYQLESAVQWSGVYINIDHIYF